MTTTTDKHTIPTAQTSKRSTLVLVTGLAALTIGAGFLITNRDVGGEEREQAEATGRQQLRQPAGLNMFAQTRAGTRGLCTFSPGTRMAYAVHSQTEVAIDFGDLGPDHDAGPHAQAEITASEASAHRVERDWTLELEAIAVDDDGASVLAARIQDRGTRVAASGGDSQASSPSPALTDTFLIRVDPRCSIREFGWRSEGDLGGAREQQIMLGGLGFHAPAKVRDAVAYGGSGVDETGRYTAAYQYREDGTVVGEAQSYAIGVAAGASRAAPIRLEILASTIEATLSSDAWFETLTNERDLVMSFNGLPFGTHFRSTEAKRTALGGFAPEVELDDGGWSWGRLGAEPQSERTQFDEELIGVPIADALARYRDLVANGKASEYGGMLRDWLRANPEGAEALAARLREGEFADEQAARAGLFFALGEANTPEAQAVLVSLLGPDERVRHQVAAAHALALVDAPTPEMVELLSAASLREGLHPVDRGSMALALGSLARSSEAHDPEVAAMARAEIRGWLSDPDADEDIRASLLAAGNAGHDALAPDIARYLDDEDPSIRRDATHALRQMSPEEAMPRLESQAFDDDRVVRTSAFETATTVMRSHEQVPPPAMIEAAASILPEAGQAEERAALRLLGEAAKRGDARADELLRDRLRDQLEGPRDPARLAALGRQLPGSWKAKPDY